MAQIEKVPVAEDRFASEWGIAVYDYSMSGKAVDLQDIATYVSQRRAMAIESEVEPMQKLIERRSQKLDNYGVVLATLTDMQSQFSDESTTTATATLPSSQISLNEAQEVFAQLGITITSLTLSFGKAQTDGCVQRLKTLIDEANNTQQKDMTRLQALVDRRDESFTTATSVMTAISDTRSTLMKNL